MTVPPQLARKQRRALRRWREDQSVSCAGGLVVLCNGKRSATRSPGAGALTGTEVCQESLAILRVSE